MFIVSAPTPFMAINDAQLSGGSTGFTAGFAFMAGYVLYSTTTFIQMRCTVNTAPTGNIDMGIYDSLGGNDYPGTLLAHTGPIAAVAGKFTQNLLQQITLSPGKYWLAITDTAGDGIGFINIQGTGMGPYLITNSGSLTQLPALLSSSLTSTNTTGWAVNALKLNGVN